MIVTHVWLRSNTMTESNLGKNGFVRTGGSVSREVSAGTQGRSWQQKLREKPWSGAAYGLDLHGSPSLLSWSTGPAGQE